MEDAQAKFEDYMRGAQDLTNQNSLMMTKMMKQLE
jgi:hypothetical protein